MCSLQTLKAFESRGIAAKRVDLLPLLPNTADHLRAYSLIDMALDTFPYAGTTTTCEALYMSVPVVTLRSDSNHAHNVGVSLLRAVGQGSLDFLVAQSEEEYVEIAVRLANDTALLTHLRSTLRATMLQSTLCDGPAFTADLERAYQSMWQRFEQSPPAQQGLMRLEYQQQQQQHDQDQQQRQQAESDVMMMTQAQLTTASISSLSVVANPAPTSTCPSSSTSHATLPHLSSLSPASSSAASSASSSSAHNSASSRRQRHQESSSSSATLTSAHPHPPQTATTTLTSSSRSRAVSKKRTQDGRAEGDDVEA